MELITENLDKLLIAFAVVFFGVLSKRLLKGVDKLVSYFINLLGDLKKATLSWAYKKIFLVMNNSIRAGFNQDISLYFKDSMPQSLEISEYTFFDMLYSEQVHHIEDGWWMEALEMIQDGLFFYDVDMETGVKDIKNSLHKGKIANELRPISILILLARDSRMNVESNHRTLYRELYTQTKPIARDILALKKEIETLQKKSKKTAPELEQLRLYVLRMKEVTFQHCMGCSDFTKCKLNQKCKEHDWMG